MIDVALCPTEIQRLAQTNLSGVTAVVFDVLRATSSMITALEHDVTALWPVETIEEAHQMKTKLPGAVLAGERKGLPIEGFDLGNSPEEFEEVAGKQVIMTTTNGTRAIQQIKHAARVLIGSLLNLDALADHLFVEPPKKLLLVCAGTGDEFSLEDSIAAGALVARLSDEMQLTDAAILVQGIYDRVGEDLREWLRQTRNGRALIKLGKGRDVDACAKLSRYDVVGILRDEYVVRLGR
jgi:2-phosphosulfolactate phosphatase